ncbi:MAG TPA: hypothetical protein VFQ53_28155 [Kofleriaceae bacterium]|nr:hypothetical protein [Kofleriaceae bacterium]
MNTPPPSVSSPHQRRIVLVATACAAAVLASQLAGKAARDAIFLQRFPVTNLPLLLALSSALAIGTTFLFARRLSRGVPARVVQLANFGSAVMLVVEWLLLDQFPRPIATIVYMHQTLLGPILVSGFWSVVSECFDPRTARQVVGTIGTGATIGGLLGAVLAERVAAMVGTSALLPAIAVIQVLVTLPLARLAHAGCKPIEADPGDVEPGEIKDVATNIANVSLLRRLAVITVVVTVAAALLDYVFKATVTTHVRKSDDLARLFATFHGAVGILTALVQWTFGRRALHSWGLARTLATLPGAVIVFGVVALVAPGVTPFVLLRGAENVLRNSLYREAYEVFYTPLLARERRSTKTVIDVGVERFGDVLGGLAVLAILALVAAPTSILVIGAIGLSVLGVVVALQAQRSYVDALERSLLAHAIDLEKDLPRDRTTRRTLELVAQGGAQPRPQGSRRWPFRRRETPARGALDPTLGRLADLTSNDATRIRRALTASLLSPAAVAHAIPLLGRRDVARDAMQALSQVAAACVGQLADALRDPLLPAHVRGKLPRLIGLAGGELARVGLMSALADPELEVRVRAAEALLELREREPHLAIDPEAVFEGVRRELALDPAAWQAFDPAAPAQHLATLLALALPAEPVKTAFQALWSDDATFRGVALEYLDNVLPIDIRDRVWTVLAIEAPTIAVAKRSMEDVRADLLRSHIAATSSTRLHAAK